MEFSLRSNFLLGVASAPTQIEGGSLSHSWTEWAKIGKIKDDSSPKRANDHFRRFKQDIDLMKSLGIKVYRLGIEWARIEPKENCFDDCAVTYYRNLLTYLLYSGIKPLLTLHHFTNPMWFERKGAFSHRKNIPLFLRFVEFAVNAFGDLVSEYITINEPNVYATHSYFYGQWPPGETSLPKALMVMSNMAVCHIKAYDAIHKIRKNKGFDDTKVSFAHHVRVFTPKNPDSLSDRFFTSLTHHAFQGAVNSAFYKGEFKLPLTNTLKVKRGEYADFIAMNYYSRSTVSGMKDGVKENVAVNDLGWEIFPRGLELCASELYKVIQRPIYITENGTCDNNDSFRSRYIFDHLHVISESGLPFERYYHWCFCDNFEWIEGEAARFGLVHVDFETQKRTVKKSGRFYSELIDEKGVSDDMYQRYVSDENYNRSSVTAND